jgi:hypothetical protein
MTSDLRSTIPVSRLFNVSPHAPPAKSLPIAPSCSRSGEIVPFFEQGCGHLPSHAGKPSFSCICQILHARSLRGAVDKKSHPMMVQSLAPMVFSVAGHACLGTRTPCLTTASITALWLTEKLTLPSVDMRLQWGASNPYV